MIRSFNRTKIIATIGPASKSYDTIIELIQAGVDVFRLNFSHGTHKEHKKVIDYIHKINKAYKLNIGILADLQGPKIRVGDMKSGPMSVETGKLLNVVTKEKLESKTKLFVNYAKLPLEIDAGERILIDDGKIELEVISTNRKDQIKTRVLHGGKITSRKGVNLPNTKLSIPSFTEKDLKDLQFALEHQANWIAISFVRSPKDISRLRKLIGKDHVVKIIAKIEKPEAMDHIDAIIKEADGIMIARGDLGVEVPLEKMPFIQKSIVRRCIAASKPVIVATQILDSMISQSRPTRAEINDVANDMIDGADSLMLSNETSVGKHPVKVVETLQKIMKYVESKEVVYNKNLTPQHSSKTFLSDAVCYNACKIAEEIGAEAIIGMTKSGYTAFMLSSYRPHAKIFIFTDNEELLNVLSVCWGVHGFYYDRFISTDETITDVISILKNANLVRKGDVIVNTGSMPLHKKGRTNMVKVTKVE